MVEHCKIRTFFFANIFFSKIVASFNFLNSMSFLHNSFFLLLLKIKPPKPLSKNSSGPFLQLLEIIKLLQKEASTITNPTSSQSEERIKHFIELQRLRLHIVERVNHPARKSDRLGASRSAIITALEKPVREALCAEVVHAKP